MLGFYLYREKAQHDTKSIEKMTDTYNGVYLHNILKISTRLNEL